MFPQGDNDNKEDNGDNDDKEDNDDDSSKELRSHSDFGGIVPFVADNHEMYGRPGWKGLGAKGMLHDESHHLSQANP